MRILVVIACLLGKCLAIQLSAYKSWDSVTCEKHGGFGSQYQCELAALAVARHDGMCFMLTSFDQEGFHDAMADPENFTGLKSDPGCSGLPLNIQDPYAAECGMGPEGGCVDEYFTDQMRREMRSKYLSTPKPAADDSCKVAFHIRRGDVSPSENSDRFIPNDVIEAVINLNFADKMVCIVSEGAESDFGDIQELGNVRFKLNDDVGTAFHNLVSAPELVIAPSSFSYSAAVLNMGQVYYIQKFWHHVLSDWKGVLLNSPLPPLMPAFMIRRLNATSRYRDFD